MSSPKWWGDWRPNLTPHTGNLQPTDLIECTMMSGGIPTNTVITGQQIIDGAGGGGAVGYYAQYQDDISQPLAVVNVGQPVKFRTMDFSNGITVNSDTEITIANTGIYNLQFSFQYQNVDSQDHDVTIWLRKNGSDVLGSAGFVAVISSHGGVPGHCLPSWNYLLDAVGGDYYELYWSATSTQVTLHYYPGSLPPPSAASAIFTVTQQAGILAGTGITALNGLSADVQTISTGTTGSDFNVVSSGTDHQFNIPTASATTRGALSTTDWSAFNGKQDALVSGTNIKTINSTSLLGSGNITTNPRTLASVNGSNLTGTAIQISASVLIPANTLVSNNTIYIKNLLTKTAGTTSSSGRIYINTSNTLSGATQIATSGAMTSTNYHQRFERNIFFDGTNLNIYSPSNGIANDLTAGVISLYSFNPANAYYLIFAVQNSTTTPDNLGHKRVIVQIYD
jgi:hypothetical protein